MRRKVTFATAAFTMIELMIGVAILAIAITALLGAFIGQMQLNEHARNLTYATNDATRVMEQLRLLNTGPSCKASGTVGIPSAIPPPGFYTWDAWLAAPASAGGGGGKSVEPTFPNHELIVVTCHNNDLSQYCGTADNNSGQIGYTSVGPQGEWQQLAATPPFSDTTFDPIRLDVAVCWRVGAGPSRQRIIGECAWNATTNSLFADNTTDANKNGVIDSPVMLTTIMTCRK